MLKRLKLQQIQTKRLTSKPKITPAQPIINIIYALIRDGGDEG